MLNNEIDKIMKLISTNINHAHPRVRHSAIRIVGKFACDMKGFA